MAGVGCAAAGLAQAVLAVGQDGSTVDEAVDATSGTGRRWKVDPLPPCRDRRDAAASRGGGGYHEIPWCQI